MLKTFNETLQQRLFQEKDDVIKRLEDELRELEQEPTISQVRGPLGRMIALERGLVEVDGITIDGQGNNTENGLQDTINGLMAIASLGQFEVPLDDLPVMDTLSTDVTNIDSECSPAVISRKLDSYRNSLEDSSDSATIETENFTQRSLDACSWIAYGWSCTWPPTLSAQSATGDLMTRSDLYHRLRSFRQWLASGQTDLLMSFVPYDLATVQYLVRAVETDALVTARRVGTGIPFRCAPALVVDLEGQMDTTSFRDWYKSSDGYGLDDEMARVLLCVGVMQEGSECIVWHTIDILPNKRTVTVYSSGDHRRSDAFSIADVSRLLRFSLWSSFPIIA